MRKTKIICTLGPATDNEEILEKLILGGMNGARFNFSHGTYEEQDKRMALFKGLREKLKKPVAMILDTKGPEIRLKNFKEGKVHLEKDQVFTLTGREVEGTNEIVSITYEDLYQDVKVGNHILIDDGLVDMMVTKIKGKDIVCQVKNSGFVSNHKGVNVPDIHLSLPYMSEKDKADIKTAALIGVDYLAVSFPRCGEDLNYARRLARDAGCDAKIVAKVERAEAVCSQDAMDDIILASDVVMVARGDLGVEIGDPELVGIQKALIRRARQLNRAVITATQMMESMITNPMPTRAEVMDVANAVLDGTDAVMLSAETAAGQYPSETVAAMARVCLGAEKIPSINVSKHRLDVQFDNVEEAIAMSAMYAANHLKGVTAIITMTESGRTALMTSRISSGLPIFAMSRHERTLNLTALYRGVTPVHFDSANDGVAAASEAVNLLRDKGYLMSGDLVIVTQGDVMSTVGSTNTTRILTVE